MLFFSACAGIWMLLAECFTGTIANYVFAYQPGRCEISISSVVKDMVRSELRSFVNPRLRSSNIKYLRFDLYTPKNPFHGQVLRTDDVSSLRESYFNPQWPVRFSIHGWAGKGTTCSNAAIKDAYLSRGPYNVIIVDWSLYAQDINYQRISKQMFAIAGSLVNFLRFLHQFTGVPFEQIYLVGHSAGCHISGLAGKLLRPEARLGAIIALDPAGLTQLNLGPRERLAPSDALYVESIHSDVTLLGNPSARLSHAAFFANWGQGQPGCPNATAAEFDFVCDHFAALYYFAEAIRNPKMFGALRCSGHPQKTIQPQSCLCNRPAAAVGPACMPDEFMGVEPAVFRTGVFYFSTKPRAPYGYADGLVHMRPPKSPTILENRPLSRSGVFGKR